MRSTNWRGNIGEVSQILDLARNELRDTFNAMVKDLSADDLTELRRVTEPVIDAAQCINNAQYGLEKFAENANELCKQEEK